MPELPLQWIKELLQLMSKLARNILRLFTGKSQLEAEPAEVKEKPLYTVIDTSRGGHNMPKKQPCSMSHGLKKRVAKTMGGALYYCNKCKSRFVVRHPLVGG